MIELLKVIIYYPFINLLTFFIWLVHGHSAAVGIILLTLLVRIVLIIPSKRAAQAQRKLAQLQPLMEELKAEYSDDKQGMAVAQMDLYKKNGINPFGSCIPVLIQFPVLIVLYRAILNGLTPHNVHVYSWVPQPSTINTNFFGIDLLHPDIFTLHLGSSAIGIPSILPLLAALTQYAYMKMVTPPGKIALMEGVEVKSDPNVMIQRQMGYILPIITLLIARGLPAGIALYWIVTTLFSIWQQQQVNKEKYRLSGVEKAITTADALHPDHKVEHHQIEGGPKQLPSPVRVDSKAKKVESTSTKKGVSVTVRKKNS